MPCYRGEYVPNHPQFAKSSVALCQGEIKPVAIDAPDIAYTEEDEKAIDQYTRKAGTSAVVFPGAGRVDTDAGDALQKCKLPGTRWVHFMRGQ